MTFRFDVKLNDQDYLDYNIFHMIRSPYFKKTIKSFRVVITAITAVFMFVTLSGGGFSLDSFLNSIPLLVILVLAQVFLARLFSWALKGTVKTMKKSGKMGYSPESVIEFYDDYFVEITPENKNEFKYVAIERVSIVDNKMIYIHINNVMSYILPLSCFESKEQYDAFLGFLNTKCSTIDVY